ncbi:MAG TPA: 50S ribosomal protein L11 methyltransferase [Bacillota bacterium]|nr:50S ribosomal protein L11 methyltransferase [Bacillota bacterium]
MKWIEICIHTTNEAVEPITNIFRDMGSDGTMIADAADLQKERKGRFGEIYELNPVDFPQEGVHIKAYFPSDSKLHSKLEKMRQEVENLALYGFDLGKNKWTYREIEDADWASAWKTYYKPVKISEKIIIVPTWEDYHPKPDEMVIELDPGMAFGTGTHPTTMLCIQALERHIQQNDVILDVGCGSGVLSIASIKLGAQMAYAFDLDDVAVSSTRQNAQLNHMEKSIKARQNNLLDGVDIRADVIVANILAEIIVPFVADAWDNLKKNGLFIASGIIISKRALVQETLQEHGFTLIEVNEMDDWVAIVAQKK